MIDYFRTPNFLGTASGTAAPGPAPALAPASAAGRNAFDVLASSGGTAIHRTDKQPLYLQHHGHSRTIVGIEIGKRSGVDGSTAGTDSGSGSGVTGGQGRVKSKIRNLGVSGNSPRGQNRGGGTEGQEEEEVWLLLFDPGRCVRRVIPS